MGNVCESHAKKKENVIAIPHAAFIKLEKTLPSVASKELEIDFKDSLEQAHVGTVVESDLMFPQVDNQHLRGGY